MGRIAGTCTRSPIPVTNPLGGHPRLGAQRPRLGFDLGIPVPGVSRRMLRRSPHVGAHPLEHRCEVRRVGRLVADPTSDDDLMGVVDAKLRVVGLDEPVGAHHDGAVGVGEVALRLVNGLALGRRQGGLSPQFPLGAGTARRVVVVGTELFELRATLRRMGACATPHHRLGMAPGGAFVALGLLAQRVRPRLQCLGLQGRLRLANALESALATTQLLGQLLASGPAP